MKTLLLLGIILSFHFFNADQKGMQGKEVTMDIQKIHWYGQAAVRIEDGQKQIYIDPWKLPSAKLPKADLIFITHAHFDHLSPEDIDKVRKDETIFVAPKDVAAQLKGTVKTIAPNQSIEVEELKITAVPAYNLQKSFHPRASGWVGYMITLSNGQKVYHAGDTDFIPEIKSLSADVALLPCGGTYTMSAREAAEAANVFKPTVAIPMHYGDVVGSDRDADAFKKDFQGETVIKKRER